MFNTEDTNEVEPERRFDKVRKVAFWFAAVVLAVFPFPLWP